MNKGSIYSLTKCSRDNYCSLRKDGSFAVDGVIGYHYCKNYKCKLEIFMDHRSSLLNDSDYNCDLYPILWSCSDTDKLSYHSSNYYRFSKLIDSLVNNSYSRGLNNDI